MIEEHVIKVARYVRDLLVYDEALIKFDREDTQQNDVDTSYIVVNSSEVSTVLSTGQQYDGDVEIMNYNATLSQSFTIEFYGNLAYSNAQEFTLKTRSQKAKEILRGLKITVYNVSSVTDVKQLLGSQYGNRVHVTFNITYTPNVNVDTLRIDETVIEYTED